MGDDAPTDADIAGDIEKVLRTVRDTGGEPCSTPRGEGRFIADLDVAELSSGIEQRCGGYVFPPKVGGLI
nr:hypothetical protein [Cutibacterium avidum]